LQTQLEPKRYYPNGSLAAHVLGYVGLDGKVSAASNSFTTRRSRRAGTAVSLRKTRTASRTRVTRSLRSPVRQ
jgi:cell division protein FtsI/penicillin-binding protein 2